MTIGFDAVHSLASVLLAGGALPPNIVRTACTFMRSPNLLDVHLDKGALREWRQIVSLGGPTGIVEVGDVDHGWGDVVRKFRAGRAMIETLDPYVWKPGDRVKLAELAPDWAMKRAAFVLSHIPKEST